MQVDIVVVATNQPELLRQLFKTAHSQTHELRFHLFLHSEDKGVVGVSNEVLETHRVVRHLYGTNRGLARSWNEGILGGYEAGAKVVLVLNDDVWFSPGDLDRLIEVAAQNRGRYAVFVTGLNVRKGTRVAHNWACFALNPIALERVGYFDENFWPVGGEDVDYVVRAKGCGLEPLTIRDTNVFHAVAATRLSQELRNELRVAQQKNAAYFRRKWGYFWAQGGTPYKRPFNNPRFGLRIAPETRHAPYPGYNRPARERRQE